MSRKSPFNVDEWTVFGLSTDTRGYEADLKWKDRLEEKSTRFVFVYDTLTHTSHKTLDRFYCST